MLLVLPPLSALETGPAATVQTLPCGKILTEIREAANIVAGDMGRKALDDLLKEQLGEKGFLGLDLSKPLLAYFVFDEKNTEAVTFVALIPITKEDDFHDLLKRLNLEPELVKGSKDFYKLGNFDIPMQDKPLTFAVTMRVIGKTAYLGFNVGDELLAADKVYKPEQIHDPKETAILAFRQFNDRVPEAMLKSHFGQLEKTIETFKKELGGLGAPEVAILASLEKVVKSLSAMLQDSKETGTRFILDTATGDFSIDAWFSPKDGTEFARSVLARKPTENQFARLVDNTTVTAQLIQMPVGFKEMQDLMVSGFEELQKKVKDDPPPPFLDKVVDEVLIGAIRTVKSGHWDMCYTLNGPDKDGHYSGIVATCFENALPLEKALKTAVKEFPGQAKELFRWDVDKVADLNVHTVEAPPDGDYAWADRIFGERKIYFAFGPKGVYAAIGSSAKESLKLAISAKPKPANVFDTLINPKRIGQFAAMIEPMAGEHFEKIMGNEDKCLSGYSFSISGGDRLKLKFNMNLKILPRLMARGFESN